MGEEKIYNSSMSKNNFVYTKKQNYFVLLVVSVMNLQKIYNNVYVKAKIYKSLRRFYQLIDSYSIYNYKELL